MSSSTTHTADLLTHEDDSQRRFYVLLAEMSKDPPADVLDWLNAYFTRKAKGRDFKRKPSMRFRSMFEERQVDVQPLWRSSGTRSARRVVLIPNELVFQVSQFSDKHKAYRWVLQVRWSPAGGFTFRGVAGGYRRGIEELVRLCDFFEAASLDREGTLRAGAAGLCCLCGKPLTDPVSMSRGIGPECWRDFIGFTSVQPSLSFEPEGGVA